jgi:hypothetical protein
VIPPDLVSLISDIQQVVQELEDAIRWAEEEIAAAASRHADMATVIEGSFRVLEPTHRLFRSEALYRAHCVELLDRVAAGGDTRPGTSAECCVVLSEVNLEVPLPTHAAGLYARLWRQAGLQPNELAAMGAHYEAIAGAQIDDLETELRRKLRQPWRVLRDDADPSAS